MRRRTEAGRVGRQGKKTAVELQLDGTPEAVCESSAPNDKTEQEPVMLVRHAESCQIRLQGLVEISAAAELKRILLEALATEGDLHLDCQRLSEVDITAVQLLSAAQHAAQSVGRQFVFDTPPPTEVVSALAEAGLGLCGIAEISH